MVSPPKKNVKTELQTIVPSLQFPWALGAEPWCGLGRSKVILRFRSLSVLVTSTMPTRYIINVSKCGTTASCFVYCGGETTNEAHKPEPIRGNVVGFMDLSLYSCVGVLVHQT